MLHPIAMEVFLRGASVASLVTCLLAACASVDAKGDAIVAEAVVSKTTLGTDPCTPVPEMPARMVEALTTTCCRGKGVCVPPTPMLGKNAELLADCEGGGKCAPKVFLEAARVPPKSCASLAGAEGVCIPTCVQAVADLRLVLPQDTCDDDERCAPCRSPLDDKPTGLCELGAKKEIPAECPKIDLRAKLPASVCASPPKLIDPSRLEPCDGGHCVPKALAGAFADELYPCPDGDSVCAPDVYLRTGSIFRPKTCTSLEGAEGRCLQKSVRQIREQGKRLPQDVCDESERCAPCFSPADGSPLPSCATSCDPGPSKPPTVFPSCEGGRGRCVAEDVVGSMAIAFGKSTCAKGYVCAPLQALDPNAAPITCTTSGGLFGSKGPGVCLESVFRGVVDKLGGVAGIEQADCPAAFSCVPCGAGGDELRGCPPAAREAK